MAILLGTALGACTTSPEGPAEVPEWHLSAEPTLIIGSDSIPQTIFGAIGSVAGLPSGEVAVFDKQSTEIRVFGPDGGYRRTIARPGGGPGEFQAILWMQAAGDSLFVKDLMLGTVTVLGVNGTAYRRVTIGVDSTERTIAFHRRLSNGGWLAAVQPAWGDPLEPQLKQDSVMFGILRPDGSGPFVELRQAVGDPMILLPATRSFSIARWHVAGIALPLGDRVAIIHADTGMVSLFSADGRPADQFSIPIPRAPVTPDAIAKALAHDGSRARTDYAREQWKLFYATEPKPALLPMLRQAWADGDDTLWFLEFNLDQTAPDRYHVVQDDGTRLGVVNAPLRFRLHQTGPDWVLGSREDADGVPQVVRYGLLRR